MKKYTYCITVLVVCCEMKIYTYNLGIFIISLKACTNLYFSLNNYNEILYLFIHVHIP